MKMTIILDIVLICVIIFAAIVFMRRGFVAGIVRFVGTLVSLFGSMAVSNKIAPIIFKEFFETGLIAKVGSMIEEQGTYYLEELVQGVASFLPIEYVQNVLNKALESINSQSATLAQDIVTNAFAPLIVPIIAIILFFILYAVLEIIISQITRVLIKINKIPLVGKVNQLLGLASGALCGVLQVTIILFAVWGVTIITNNALPFVNSADLQGSMFYSTFLKFNPFFH